MVFTIRVYYDYTLSIDSLIEMKSLLKNFATTGRLQESSSGKDILYMEVNVETNLGKIIEIVTKTDMSKIIIEKI